MPESPSGSAPSAAETPPLAIGIARGELCALAARPIKAGECILELDGNQLAQPSSHSIQVATEMHLAAPLGTTRDQLQAGFAWRYVNHACTPNAFVRERALLALRDIPAATEVLCRYDADQYELAEPFNCLCGQDGCRGRITGYRDLTADERRELAEIVQPHVLAEAETRDEDRGEGDQ